MRLEKDGEMTKYDFPIILKENEVAWLNGFVLKQFER